MKILLFSLTCLLFLKPPEKYLMKEWSTEELRIACTAKDAPYLNQEEQALICYLNLARLYPQRYLQIEVLQNSYKEGSRYKRSLIKTLKKMAALPALTPERGLARTANCFAVESGKRGTTGHKRKKCADQYDAECCSYGYQTGQMIALQLLVDDEVKKTGHRQICLSEKYSRIGVAIKPHKHYECCAVLDFGNKP